MRRVSLAIALLPLLAAGVGSSGCGAPVETGEDRRAITVHPRVVVDGTWQLATRGDRVVIDEMLFHAPDVLLHADGARATDVLATDPDDQGPLLFRYDITSDGFGDIVGGERNWVLETSAGAADDASLVFDFAPFVPDVETLSKLEAESGVPLDGLAGHTAMVHGYLLTESASKSGGFGNECDGDPDGNPASCPEGASAATEGATADGDPDGNPARPQDDDASGDTSDGDPDGNPAKTDPADGDPDGNPAKTDPADGDPDGNPADGDPDGNPSQGHPDDDTRGGAMHTQKGAGAPRPVGASPTTRQRVPFVLVLNREMSFSVPVADLLAQTMAPGEVLPIDLHVQLDDLITDELLALLNQEAARQDKGLIVVEVPDVCMEMNVAADGVVHVRREAVSGGGIKVVSGR